MMQIEPYNYSIFFDFIESYLPNGFQNIKAHDAIMLKLEEVMKINNQYFNLIELEEVKFLFTSKGSLALVGIEAEELNPSHYLEITHPEDIYILEWARIQIFKLEKEFFEAKKGSGLMSYTIRMRDPSGGYHNYLGQDYLFYGASPKPAVYAIQIGTRIDWCKIKDICNHRYIGKDISLFKFPDEKLLKIGLVYSAREIEILKFIELGLNSNDIAEKLELSLHTVNTHRGNILEKSGKDTISELLFELKEQGLL